jgi:hypothetical protein
VAVELSVFSSNLRNPIDVHFISKCGGRLQDLIGKV